MAQTVVWRMPHHGASASRSSCGEQHFRAHEAGDKYHVTPYTEDCRQYDCPRASCRSRIDHQLGTVLEVRGYESRVARRVARRVDRFGNPTMTHVVYSVPPELGIEALEPAKPKTPDEPLAKRVQRSYGRFRKRATKRLRASGARGGVAILHYDRIAKPGLGKHACTPGPHVHALCTSDKPYCVHGKWHGGITPAPAGADYIVKNIGIRKSVFRTAAYVASHAARAAIETNTAPEGPERGIAALRPGTGYEHEPATMVKSEYVTQAVWWFGSMALNKVPPKAEPDEADRVCAVCHERIPIESWKRVRPRTWRVVGDEPFAAPIDEWDEIVMPWEDGEAGEASEWVRTQRREQRRREREALEAMYYVECS